ncbi:hypothetical protein MNBD_ACTINO01-1331 [hydrothermal vent metagenome]|uniref:Uncharacterized protein n=1 Tax=hydrothermal vent metagenome TaxID=652676 RepID=A0A3B0SDW2_9ZZZZ
MLTRTFNRLFSRLVTSFERYQDVPRSPQNVIELASARHELDLARSAIAVERHIIMSGGGHREPVRRTAVSQDNLARLRVLGTGFVSG